VFEPRRCRNQIVLVADLQRVSRIEKQADVGALQFAPELFDCLGKSALVEIEAELNLKAELLQRLSDVGRIVFRVTQCGRVHIGRIADDQRNAAIRLRRGRGYERNKEKTKNQSETAQHDELLRARQSNVPPPICSFSPSDGGFTIGQNGVG